MVHCCQRSSLADHQYRAIVEHVAGQGLGTLYAARSRSRFGGLVLGRPAPVADTWRKLALCPAGKHPIFDRFIDLHIRSWHKNILIEKRGT